jgi:hypothetical protein
MHILVKIFFLLCLATVTACAQDVPVVPAPQESQKKEKPKPESTAAPRMPADRNKFAVIISGISGEEGYAKRFGEWTGKLREILITDLGFAEDQVTVLTEKPEGKEQRATAEVIRQTLVALRNNTNKDNQVFVFFIGHGSFDGKIAKFMLVGPDLSATDYAQLINNLPTRNVVIVNMASASGEFIKPLSGNGRIIITATRSGNEQNATKFPEHFIAALGNPEADADKNGRVSVLEAFNYATKLTSDSYGQAGKLVTEHALLDDNGDSAGHQKAEAGDGVLAKTTYFDSLPQQRAGGDAELAKLFSERMRLEGEVEQLKARKDQMKAEDYEAALEKLLIELAKVSQGIRAKQK